MIEKETIRGLECCTDESYENCNECPYSIDTVSCERMKLLEDSLDLINRLKAEIERLESANDEKFRQWDMLAEKTKQHYADLYNEAKDILKAEAYKEFAERLNEKAQIADCFDSYNMVVGTHFIDNLLKEMVGEEK